MKLHGTIAIFSFQLLENKFVLTVGKKIGRATFFTKCYIFT